MTPTPEAIKAAVLEYHGNARYFAKPEEIAAMSRALAAYESAMEAAGFVRVPVELTPLMGSECPGLQKLWRAMIAARPSANKGERG